MAPSFGSSVGCAAAVIDWDDEGKVINTSMVVVSVASAQTVSRAETQATLLADWAADRC